MIKKNKTAFTLVELAIVITIITTIISVLAIGGGSLRTRARMITARSLTRTSPVKDIPNLELWLESTSSDSFNQSEITSSTGKISTWYDINKQSNYQNNATQATSGLQPIYTTNVINGLPAVYFGSSAAIGMTIASTLNVNSNYSAFVVFYIGSAYTGTVLQSQSQPWLIGTWNSGVDCVCYYVGGNWVSNPALLNQAFNKAFLVEGIRNTISKFYINGVDNTVNNSYISPPGNLSLGASANFNVPMGGYIGEVIVFTRDLNDSERQDVENYLIKKWKIS